MASSTSLGNLQRITDANPILNNSSLGATAQDSISSLAQNTLSQASHPSTFSAKSSAITWDDIRKKMEQDKLHFSISKQPILSLEQIQEKHKKFVEEQKALTDQQILLQQEVIRQQQEPLTLKSSFQRLLNPQHTEQLYNPFPSIEESTVSMLKAGLNSLYGDRKYSDAIYSFQVGLKNAQLHPEFRASDETNALLNYHMGNAYQLLDNFGMAILTYQSALSFEYATNETKAVIYGALADIHYQKG